MDVRLDNLLSLHRIRPMIMVFPDGRIGGSTYSDSEWANTPSGDYLSYVVNVVHDVDQRFATIPQRVERVIGGFSAGAYGATNVALHNLSLFGSLQSWSGYYVETRTGVFAHASRGALADNSPLYYVRRLDRRAGRSTRSARSCSSAATTTPVRSSSRWPRRWPPAASRSATRSIAAATTGSCGTPTSTRCSSWPRVTSASH